ncbi:MAG: GHKL domain-containing protein [Thaumarchaeota archaeon]|nr:GHKL domain-containing protein [Nitrososphaerota archaeon]
MSQQAKEGSPKIPAVGLAEKELQELSVAERDLQEKERHLNHLTSESIEKLKDVSKINRDLQNRVKSLQELSVSVNRKNDELKKANQELERQKNENYKISIELKEKLEKVLEKERELSLQRDFLAKQLEETTKDLIKAEKFAVIGELAARLAHDLRNPLSVIKNTMDIITARPNLRVDERLQYTARFRRAVQRMSHQIDDVLDYVKKTDLVLQTTSLLTTIENAINGLVVPPNARITKPQSDVQINCDSRKLEAVFSNIITNAIQAMDEKGEIKIRVADAGSNVRIDFEDTGPGIPANIINRVFDPLFTTKLTGTGLGLSICKSIVEQHGGTIAVKSPPTVFTINIPKNSITQTRH